MIFKVPGLKEENAKKFECLSYTLIAHKKSCEFCKHLSDTFYDFTHGPYLFFCDRGIDVNMDILRNGCNGFEKDEVKNGRDND